MRFILGHKSRRLGRGGGGEKKHVSASYVSCNSTHYRISMSAKHTYTPSRCRCFCSSEGAWLTDPLAVERQSDLLSRKNSADYHFDGERKIRIKRENISLGNFFARSYYALITRNFYFPSVFFFRCVRLFTTPKTNQWPIKFRYLCCGRVDFRKNKCNWKFITGNK